MRSGPRLTGVTFQSEHTDPSQSSPKRLSAEIMKIRISPSQSHLPHGPHKNPIPKRLRSGRICLAVLRPRVSRSQQRQLVSPCHQRQLVSPCHQRQLVSPCHQRQLVSPCHQRQHVSPCHQRQHVSRVTSGSTCHVSTRRQLTRDHVTGEAPPFTAAQARQLPPRHADSTAACRRHGRPAQYLYSAGLGVSHPTLYCRTHCTGPPGACATCYVNIR